MKCYALLAASLALAAASPTGVKFVDDDGNVEFITFGNGVLTVPQHCRDNTCNTLTAYAKAQTTFAQAQASENAALRGLITSLRTDLVALSKKHGDDIAVVVEHREHRHHRRRQQRLRERDARAVHHEAVRRHQVRHEQ